MSFRIAELIKKAESQVGEEAEISMKEATEVILRLWSMRERWPQGPPMQRIEELMRTFDQGSRPSNTPVKPHDWVALLEILTNICNEEKNLLLHAILNGFDFETEKQRLVEFDEKLNQREHQILELIESAQHSVFVRWKTQVGDQPELQLAERLLECLTKRRAAIEAATSDEGENDET